jgi:hypothetical protein
MTGSPRAGQTAVRGGMAAHPGNMPPAGEARRKRPTQSNWQELPHLRRPQPRSRPPSRHGQQPPGRQRPGLLLLLLIQGRLGQPRRGRTPNRSTLLSAQVAPNPRNSLNDVRHLGVDDLAARVAPNLTTHRLPIACTRADGRARKQIGPLSRFPDDRYARPQPFRQETQALVG